MYAIPKAQKKGLRIEITNQKPWAKNSMLLMDLKIKAVIKIIGIRLK